jgi:hypothetical protein
MHCKKEKGLGQGYALEGADRGERRVRGCGGMGISTETEKAGGGGMRVWETKWRAR